MVGSVEVQLQARDLTRHSAHVCGRAIEEHLLVEDGLINRTDTRPVVISGDAVKIVDGGAKRFGRLAWVVDIHR